MWGLWTDDQAMGLAFLFGIAYNLLIGWLHQRNGGDGGLVALEVVGGVMGVLIIGSFITATKHYSYEAFGIVHMLSNGQSAAWIMFRLFLAAGIPMVAGSVWRYTNAVE